MNGNLIYKTGIGGCLGFFGENNITNIEDWQNPLIGPGQDMNSYFGDPHFVNPSTSYEISLRVNTLANNNGRAGTFVGKDIVDNNRSHFRPDIGAYEFTGAYLINLKVSLQACLSDYISVSLYDDFLCIPIATRTVNLSGTGPINVYFTRVVNYFP